MLERRADPTRSCVHCRTSRAKRDLLRVVRAPDGTIHLDASGRANGRGAYVCRDEACIAGATGRGGLGRALEITLPADLADQLLTAMRGGVTDGAQ
ncbi:MAG TPA: YlxR family protein [Candidatus Dormibacteraeota bacterium]|nr:YlxR family protein [Candidatus Dormibacteraeota bacterium]